MPFSAPKGKLFLWKHSIDQENWTGVTKQLQRLQPRSVKHDLTEQEFLKYPKIRMYFSRSPLLNKLLCDMNKFLSLVPQKLETVHLNSF